MCSLFLWKIPKKTYTECIEKLCDHTVMLHSTLIFLSILMTLLESRDARASKTSAYCKSIVCSIFGDWVLNLKLALWDEPFLVIKYRIKVFIENLGLLIVFSTGFIIIQCNEQVVDHFLKNMKYAWRSCCIREGKVLPAKLLA